VAAEPPGRPAGTAGQAVKAAEQPRPDAPAPGWAVAWHGRAVRAYGLLDALRRRVPRLVAVLRIVYYPAAIALVAWMGVDAARGLEQEVNWAAVAGCFVAALVWWLSQAYSWANLVSERFDHDQVGRWCRTQVTRYLPGGIWAPLARSTLVHGRVRDKLAAVAAENVIQLCLALAVGGLWMIIRQPRFVPLAILGVVPLALAGWLQRRTKVSRRGIARASVVAAVGWVAYGVSAVLAQVAVTGLRDDLYPLYIAGAACVAWAIGLVAVFAPSGVGVREVVYVWFLSSFYPRAGLQGASVLQRLVTIAAELAVLIAIGLPWVRRRMERPAPEPAPGDPAPATDAEPGPPRPPRPAPR
jgi:glycosyltransferase 2 family protein